MDTEEILKELCLADGISGNENSVAKVACKLMSEICETRIDENYNVCATMGDMNSSRHIMLDAHIDQIGFVVTNIDENGFISFSSVGGFDKRILNGTKVLVLGKEKVKGQIRTKKEASETVNSFDDLFIDVALSADKIKELISLGNNIVIDTEFKELLNGNISSKSLDNRCGVASLIRCADLLKDKELNCKISFVFSSQEETSSAGAVTKAFGLSPDEAIVIDVSFAKQFNSDKEYLADLGGGPMIGISPILNNKLTQCLKNIAKRENIPYQLEVMGSSTGTNSDLIAVSKSGVKTALLSVPLRYMHTAVEVVNIGDVENTALLLSRFF